MRYYSQVMKRFFALLMIFTIWFCVGLITFITFIAIAICRPFDPKSRFTYRIANLWGKSIMTINPQWKIKISGTEHIENNKGYVLVSNHTSLADIICLYCLGKNFKWVAKSSLFKIPFFGWTMSLLDYIPLSRGKHGSIRDSYRDSIEWLNKDISVLIFPEGTRSKTGQLAEFKNGAFKLALLTKKPIVPIVISGAEKAITKGEAKMAFKVAGSVTVLPPIDLGRYAESDYEKLKTDVWNLMNNELLKSEA